MESGSIRVCRRVIYRGHVQGVGFRWTTFRVAKGHSVAGTVRNRPDGTVELVAQGVLDSVNRFLEEIADVMSACIEHADVSEESVQADLSGFTILQ